MSAEPYQVWQVWKYSQELRVITDEGPFADGQVPVDYTGPELRVWVTQRIYMTNSSGQIMELRFDDLGNVMNNARETGLGATAQLPMGGGLVVPGTTGPNVAWMLKSNPALDAKIDTRASAMWQQMVDLLDTAS